MLAATQAWLLMCMLTKTFPPSERMSLYLLNFLIGFSDTKVRRPPPPARALTPASDGNVPQGLIGNFAHLCLVQLDSMFELGPSWFSPSLEDIVAYTKRPPVLAMIWFVDGTSRQFAVTPDVTVELLTKAIARTAKHVR
jgi:hypothetical protein